MTINRTMRGIVFVILALSFSMTAFSQVFVSVRIGPPALPVYEQPFCPGPGYIWTPGYWGWNDDAGYYWVPGTWVFAPVGMYWTPGYWGWDDGFYVFHRGYWGPHIGFYGGIDYGFGYTGVGWAGGEWRGGALYYNRSVTNVNVTNVTNVYNKTVIVNNTTVNRISYNGGTGGVNARPTRQEEVAEHERHREPLAEQMKHEHAASQNRQLFARENHGRPPVAATAKPADFRGHIVPAKAAGAPYHAPAISPREARGPARTENRPFTPVSSNSANRPTNRPFNPPSAADKPKSNEGFRPFNPPNSKGSKAAPADRSSNPQARDKMGNAQSNPMYKENNNSGTNPLYESKDKMARPPERNQPSSNASRPAPQREARPQQESRPERESRPTPPQRDNAPRRESAPPPQHHESAPPAPRRDSPPPKQEKERPNKGR